MFFLLPLQTKGRCKSYPNSVMLTAFCGSMMIILPVIAVSMWLRKKTEQKSKAHGLAVPNGAFRTLKRPVLNSKTPRFASQKVRVV